VEAVSKAVGGYVRRGERRHIPPDPDDDIPRCDSCRARLDFVTPWNQPHICKEITYGTASSPYRAEVFPDTGNQGCYWPAGDAGEEA